MTGDLVFALFIGSLAGTAIGMVIGHLFVTWLQRLRMRSRFMKSAQEQAAYAAQCNNASKRIVSSSKLSRAQAEERYLG